MTVNYEFFDKASVESAHALVGALRQGERPAPTRGAPLCTFREISRQLAGLGDDREGAVEGAAIGEPTLIGVRLAAERGEAAPAYPDGRLPAGEAT
jgi:NADH-quinone oxidoreductase subunit E